MFESLTAWCKFPVTICSMTGRNAAGDETFSTSSVNGYRVDDNRSIVDKHNHEYVSRSQVYLKPNTAITLDDKIQFPEDDTMYEVRKIGGYFDGNTGALDILVVYL